jgi:prephenate dehydratase
VKGGCDGLVPVENSEAGGVGPTLDCLQSHPVYITGEAYMEVHHHCAAFEEPERLTLIYAHPQTHEQCSEFLEKLGI